MKNTVLIDYTIDEISRLLVKHTLFMYESKVYEAISSRVINRDKISITNFGGYLTLNQVQASSIVITGFNDADALRKLVPIEDYEKPEVHIVKPPRSNFKSVNTVDQPKKPKKNSYSDMDKFLILTKDSKTSWDELAKKLGRLHGISLYQLHRKLVAEKIDPKDLARKLNITYENPQESVIKLLKGKETVKVEVEKFEIESEESTDNIETKDCELREAVLVPIDEVNISETVTLSPKLVSASCSDLEVLINSKIEFHKSQLLKLENMLSILTEAS